MTAHHSQNGRTWKRCALWLAALLLAACSNNDSYVSTAPPPAPPAPPPPPPPAPTEVPASAVADVTSFVNYLNTLAQSNNTEPLGVNVTPPVSDTTEPAAL